MTYGKLTVQQPVCNIPENSTTTSHASVSASLGTTRRTSLAECLCRGRDLIWLEKKSHFLPFAILSSTLQKPLNMRKGGCAIQSVAQPSRLPFVGSMGGHMENCPDCGAGRFYVIHQLPYAVTRALLDYQTERSVSV